jgi:hypothetical protein
MRLYRGSVTKLSDEIVKALLAAGDIEASAPREVVADVEAVFNNYLDVEREVSERAKDALQSRNLPQTDLPRVKKAIAEQKGIKTGEDTLDFLLDQLIQILMHSANVDEVFREDHELRRTMRPALRKHLEIEQAVEQEVRSKLKHVQEGSRTWEVEYRRVLEEVQRRKGLG